MCSIVASDCDIMHDQGGLTGGYLENDLHGLMNVF